ncbi:Dps family protein [Cytophagales bacterium LB-30]|uniref:Dps family protein n=1 Tax=Shiella aurantiaca TaxID=3058365 RepID=A0ABT8F2V7_9BACT|nr:Dps family protein [Shiella aurantiaca]MDN4164708.1 Dps family protein [Shiella aurantiaca]
MKNQVGLDQEKSNRLAEKLNLLLADYMMFYINVRGYHWNIKGDKFFELHVKFEELYTNLILKVDEIAERIVTLGVTPKHSYSDYIRSSDLGEELNVSDGVQAVKNILSSYQLLLTKQREILALAADADDEGTNALMSDYIREQEKLVWMYSSFMGK